MKNFISAAEIYIPAAEMHIPAAEICISRREIKFMSWMERLYHRTLPLFRQEQEWFSIDIRAVVY